MTLSERLPEGPHALPAAEALALLNVSAATGLGDEEVRRRALAYGLNTIMSRRRISALAVLAHLSLLKNLSGLGIALAMEMTTDGF